jgi:metallophosphoesterase superfamily enzyme
MNKRNTFFKQVDQFINEYSIGQIILAGDYNDILSKTETKKLYQSKKFDKPVHNLKILYSLINLSTCLKKVFLLFILLGA